MKTRHAVTTIVVTAWLFSGGHKHEIVREETHEGENENGYGRVTHCNQKRRIHTQFRQQAPQVGYQGPDLTWQHRTSCGARPTGRASNVDGGEDWPSGADRLSLGGFRKDLEGSVEASSVREGAGRREGARSGPRLLARAGPRERAGRLVRWHVAAGVVPL